jgi:hypothetical protein
MKVRSMIEAATNGQPPSFTVTPLFKKMRPRLYDKDTDFGDLSGRYGVYLIYASRWPRTARLGPSRIQYIGRGHLGPRLWTHLDKMGLARLARSAELKFVAFEVGDEPSEFVFESILLNEHEALFRELPQFNKARGSPSMLGWRSVLRMSPGPRAVLTHYGAW